MEGGKSEDNMSCIMQRKPWITSACRKTSLLALVRVFVQQHENVRYNSLITKFNLINTFKRTSWNMIGKVRLEKSLLNEFFFRYDWKIWCWKYAIPNFDRALTKVIDVTSAESLSILSKKKAFESCGKNTSWLQTLTSPWCHKHLCVRADKGVDKGKSGR